jgi:hypothetical protein
MELGCAHVRAPTMGRNAHANLTEEAVDVNAQARLKCWGIDAASPVIEGRLAVSSVQL